MALDLIVPVVVPILFAGVAVAVFLVGDRLRPESWRHEDEESGHSFVLDLVNMFFAAVVAFVVVIAWQEYDNAHAHTVEEAKALIEVHAAAGDLPEAEGTRVRELVRDYTDEVMSGEWAVMAAEGRLSAAAQELLDEVEAAVEAVRSTDPLVVAARADALDALDTVGEARFERALTAEYRMPRFLYLALWLATAMLLCGTVLSGVVVTRRSVIMTALFGLVVGGVILAVYQLDQPFSGANVVPTDAFELARTRFESGD
ncbi:MULTISPECIES: DUF4239 domain-containing protein [unclassified Nocardia]|uniref:bestrophin-like domain n=1 Tax=unclassified Nocardia TaxID=2637762 RepID=UPI0024A86612|nr:MULTISPECIES: DUF4239 domain-containing protein [unclassified Nocardia]